MADVSKNLPKYYGKSRYIKALNTPVNSEFDTLSGKIDTFILNRFIDTADEDTIKRFEKAFGLEAVDYTLDARKGRILAKMRGTGMMTVAAMKAVAESFGAAADITENISDYSFWLIYHAPPTVTDKVILGVFDDLKPAHLAMNMEMEDNTSWNRYIAGIVVADVEEETLTTEIAGDYDTNADFRLYNGLCVLRDVQEQELGAVRYATYRDLAAYTYGQLSNKAYHDILYKEDY